MKTRVSTSGLAASALALFLLPVAAIADSGFYIGAAAGGATTDVEFGDVGIPDFPTGEFDEDDTGFKAFAGYMFDLPVIDLGIEAGYVDFGAPEIDTNFETIEIDPTGINVWGIASIEAGPIDLFAKLGYIFWDVEASGFGETVSEDGSDLGYGVGLGFDIGALTIRAELEAYVVSDSELSMLSMLSLGVLYRFN